MLRPFVYSCFWLLASGLALPLAGCAGPCATATRTPTTGPAAVEPQLQEQLTELMKAHDDKMQLAWFVAMPLHKVDPAVHVFFERLYKDHQQLRDQLNAWAKTNHYKLKFTFGADLAGRARKAMEDAQGTKLQQDNSADFQHDVLAMMDLDLANNKCLAKELLKAAPDDALRAYLTESIKVYDAEIGAAQALLRRYKFQ